MTTTSPADQKRLIGIWDLESASLSLGGLLILLADLRVLRERLKANLKFDIVFTGDAGSIVDVETLDSADGSRVVTAQQPPASGILSMLLGMENVENCYFVENRQRLPEFLQDTGLDYYLWPDITGDGLKKHEYGFTTSVRQSYRETGSVPHLCCRPQHTDWAKNFIEANAGERTHIALHLKNTIRKSGKADWYNADFAAWTPFLKSLEQRDDIVFTLIGNEPIPEDIQGLSNILIAQDQGSNLIRDLALIQCSAAFMGVASGPCNMAILGPGPYVIFKTPGHHDQWVDAEIGPDHRLEFAKESQRFLVQTQTPESLYNEFNRLCSSLGMAELELSRQ